MPTSSVGRASKRGVTLLEMLVVVTIIGIMAGVSFPSVTSGIDSLRLNGATRSVVAFLNSALNRAEQSQQPMEVTINKTEGALYVRSVDPTFMRKLELPEGVTISKVLPELPDGDDPPTRIFMLYPGGTVPGIGLVLMNQRKALREVEVDPMTGVPQISVPTT